jgi:hypothetical protein
MFFDSITAKKINTTTYTERHYIRDGLTQHAELNGTIQSQNFICWVLTTPSMLLHYLQSFPNIILITADKEKMARVYNVLSYTFQRKPYFFGYQIISALVATWSKVWVVNLTSE